MSPEEKQDLVEQIASEIVKQVSALQSADGDINWSKVDLGEKPANSRPRCADLSHPDLFRLKSIALLLYGGSVAEVLRTAIAFYLAKKWPGHLKRFRAIAAREGMSIEDCISAIVRGDLEP